MVRQPFWCTDVPNGTAVPSVCRALITSLGVIAERLSARQLIVYPFRAVCIIYLSIYMYVCNASGMQLSIPICVVYGVIRSLHQDTVHSRT